MSVAKVTEITSSSKKSFDDAMEKGIKRACKTLSNVTGAWIQDQKVDIKESENHLCAERLTVRSTLAARGKLLAFFSDQRQ
jgi:flavin-binding protein dodecin